MISAWVVTIAAFATGPEMGMVRMQAALGSMQRLGSAVLVSMPNAPEEAKEVFSAYKAELEALLIYLGKVQDVAVLGKWNAAYSQNMFKVLRQVVVAGQSIAVLPEEALCWERAGLDFASAFLGFTRQQVAAGKLPSQALVRANTEYESARRSYLHALARCITTLD